MPSAVVLFAKTPVPGGVKTRLTPPLSDIEAAAFHSACVRDVWEKIAHLEARRYFYSDSMWLEAGEDPPVGAHALRLQRGANLGERMFHCFRELAEEGHGAVLIVGSDSPTLPASYLAEGIEALSRTDCVLGPTEDGGYYAIGCRAPHPEMFAGVPWSSPETMARTAESLRTIGRSIHSLASWYDVDTVDDLRRLAGETSLPSHVGRWVAGHRGLLS